MEHTTATYTRADLHRYLRIAATAILDEDCLLEWSDEVIDGKQAWTLSLALVPAHDEIVNGKRVPVSPASWEWNINAVDRRASRGDQAGRCENVAWGYAAGLLAAIEAAHEALPALRTTRLGDQPLETPADDPRYTDL